MKDFAFQPNSVTVRPGDTVTWSNVDTATHTATSAGNWDTGNMPPGSSRSIAFATPGTYLYFCLLHSIMFGTIVVVAADATPSPSPAPRAVAGEATPSPASTSQRSTLVAAAADATAAPIVLRRPSESGPGPIIVAAAALAIVVLSAFAWSVGRQI